jgi:hypothetical protein
VSWLILSLLNVVLSRTHSRVKGISPNRTPQTGRAIGLSWTAMSSEASLNDFSFLLIIIQNPPLVEKQAMRQDNLPAWLAIHSKWSERIHPLVLMESIHGWITR